MQKIILGGLALVVVAGASIAATLVITQKSGGDAAARAPSPTTTQVVYTLPSPTPPPPVDRTCPNVKDFLATPTYKSAWSNGQLGPGPLTETQRLALGALASAIATTANTDEVRDLLIRTSQGFSGQLPLGYGPLEVFDDMQKLEAACRL